MVLKKEHEHRETGVLKTEHNIYSFRKENQVNKHVVITTYQHVEERKRGLMLVCMGDTQ